MHLVNKTIVLQGNIGAGKSTLLEEIIKIINEYKLKYYIVKEPIDEWNKEIFSNQSILELFYSDKEKYGFVFQIFAFSTRLDYLDKVIKENYNKFISRVYDYIVVFFISLLFGILTLLFSYSLSLYIVIFTFLFIIVMIILDYQSSTINLISERSLRSDKIFFENIVKMYNLELEWNVYNKFFDISTNVFNVKDDIVIYLNSSPEVCLERIKKRNRPSEKEITLEYLQDLDKNHKEMIKDYDKVLEIEWNYKDEHEKEEIIRKVLKFIEENI